ncbi:MAG: hypothetical protein PGN07_00220 [Aeromicrobium erythreum]
MLEQLAEAREVAPGRGDVAVGLDRVEPARTGSRVGHPPVGRGAGDHDVVAGAVRQRAEDGLDRPVACLDVDALVADRVAVVPGGSARHDVADADVAVAEDEAAVGHRVGLVGRGVVEEVVQRQVPGLERVVRGRRLVRDLPDLARDDRRGDGAVVEQGGVGGEPLLAHELLVEQGAVGVAELGVALAGHGPDLAVVRHREDLEIN